MLNTIKTLYKYRIADLKVSQKLCGEWKDRGICQECPKGMYFWGDGHSKEYNLYHITHKEVKQLIATMHCNNEEFTKT